jgi:hypothetical protein
MAETFDKPFLQFTLSEALPQAVVDSKKMIGEKGTQRLQSSLYVLYGYTLNSMEYMKNG